VCGIIPILDFAAAPINNRVELFRIGGCHFAMVGDATVPSSWFAASLLHFGSFLFFRAPTSRGETR
jgi:hypothetical protein